MDKQKILDALDLFFSRVEIPENDPDGLAYIPFCQETLEPLREAYEDLLREMQNV